MSYRINVHASLEYKKEHIKKMHSLRTSLEYKKEYIKKNAFLADLKEGDQKLF